MYHHLHSVTYILCIQTRLLGWEPPGVYLDNADNSCVFYRFAKVEARQLISRFGRRLPEKGYKV